LTKVYRTGLSIHQAVVGRPTYKGPIIGPVLRYSQESPALLPGSTSLAERSVGAGGPTASTAATRPYYWVRAPNPAGTVRLSLTTSS